MGDFEDIILPGEGNDPVDDNTPENGEGNSGNNNGDNNSGDNNSEDTSIGGGDNGRPKPIWGVGGLSIDSPEEDI